MSAIPVPNQQSSLLSRRELLRLSGVGLGSLPFMGWLSNSAAFGGDTLSGQAVVDLRARDPHFDAKATSVIFMMQTGGPSQMDLFDPKPQLNKNHGRRFKIKPETFDPGSEKNLLMACPFRFQRYGQSGMELSELIPNIGSLADDVCLVRSMRTNHNSHAEALMRFTTGRLFQGWPTFGSWICYALGTENQNLPANVVLRDPSGYSQNGALNWTSGWLPALYRGTEFSSEGEPIRNLHTPRDYPAGVQQENLRYLNELNRMHQRRRAGHTELESRIQNYELAARMQESAQTAVDISSEPESVHKLYGLDNPTTRPYGLRCLMARKLVEAGVRFVQIYPKGFREWDHHESLQPGLKKMCGLTDLPTAALIKDLKDRGLLESTIVIWAGEFGRLPVSQVQNGMEAGRDHNPNAFSLFVAGGGFQSGYIHGETDEFGYNIVRDPVTVADLHATILHQLGLDHDLLTYHHAGRDETLTDSSATGATVIHELLADA